MIMSNKFVDLKVKKLYEDTYCITEAPKSLGGVNMYLLVGKERALLIDSAYGASDLPAICAKITDKPVTCVCTHGHVDHALGAFMFEDAYIHSKDVELYNEHKASENIESIFTRGIGAPVPEKLLNTPGYSEHVKALAQKPRRELKLLDDVESFELGERRVTWRLLPGHTQGSTVFFDEKYNAVFDGDAAPMGVWIFLDESLSVPEYRAELVSYYDYLEKNGVKRLYAGHYSKPSKIRHIKKMIACCDTIIGGKKKPMAYKLAFSGGEVKIMLANGACIFYK